MIFQEEMLMDVIIKFLEASEAKFIGLTAIRWWRKSIGHELNLMYQTFDYLVLCPQFRTVIILSG